uniref:BTB domain-containing protein n=1 Tax=Ditylenchus dipsaci TaxID=166011 RepID=A0A915CWF3_9BILA
MDYANYVIVFEHFLGQEFCDWMDTANFELLDDLIVCRQIFAKEGSLQESCFAEVAFSVMDEGKKSPKTLRRIFQVGDTMELTGISSNYVTIRILQDKLPYLHAFKQYWANDVTFLVNGIKCMGDRAYLSAISPVFQRMFNGQFVEAHQQEVELQDIDLQIYLKTLC